MKNLIIWALTMFAVFYGGAKFYLHKEVADAMDMAVLMMAPFAAVEYDGVASTMSGELTIEGVRVRPNEFKDELYIERLGIDTPSFLSLLEISDYITLQGDGVPDYFGFIIDGVHLPVEADYFETLYELSHELAADVTDADDPAAQCTGKYGFSPTVLAALGYQEQVFSLTMTARNDEGQYSFELESNIEDMWDADARIILAGDMMSELSRGSAYRPRLRNLELEYTDQSLNGRIAEYCARLGLTPEQTLQAQMDAFQFYGASNGIEFDEYLLEPYKEFLGGKSSIIFTAKPHEPVAMSQIDLYKPSDVPALLNLEAQAR